ncbi:adenylate kinase family protein [Mycoplasma nasistruthionis]|uniref:Adenylate kinase n=1 Tax=Mycoplasma nasistruthionis TaxID=353852 RepID=A0A4Y6I679_9MOLU|nr:nucleoside monophosphate kinase [Mycoplasma nasistruthionis]QDF65124.1 nucleoside monophosphate kinase [Mycoplasma nasistruthionis]
MIKQINKNVLLMGQPGAGKGTVAGVLTQKSNLLHLSTGNIFRQEISNQTELGLKVKDIVTSGGYVPDEITNQIVKKAITKLKDNGEYFILDGFPRTSDQAKFLSSLPGFDFVVFELVVSKEIILERLNGRRLCPTCSAGYHIKYQPPKVDGLCDKDSSVLIQRADDAEDKIIERLKVYDEKTLPLLNFYQSNGELIQIDASLKPEEVADKILEILEKNSKI